MHPARLTRRSLLGVGAALTVTGTTASAARMFSRPAIRSASPQLTGQVILPTNAEYDEARLTFNTRLSRFPAVIIRCFSVADVQNAVRWARHHDMPLRVRSGGHSYEAFSVVDDGLVIDVSPLNEISVDLASGQAVVGAGVRLGELYRALSPYGVTIPAGTCPLVGVAGITLGGGIGFQARQYGLTCDNLLAVDLVDAEGNVLRATETDHPDLFWALRGGGGGNFGIATAFTFRLRPVGTVATFSLSWPRELMPDVLETWQDWAPYADGRMTAGLNLSLGGEVSAAGTFNGSEAELQSLLAPLYATAPPTAAVESVNLIDFILGQGMPVPHAMFKNTSTLAYDPLSTAAIATLAEHLSESLPPGANLVQLFPFGGAIAAVSPKETAFVHRHALFDLQYQAYWWEPVHEPAHIEWIRGIRTAMLPYMRGAYVNYIDADIPDWVSAYYGSNLRLLSRVKAAYDPDDVFSGPQSIPL